MRVGSRSHTAAAVMEVALADTLTSMGFERRSATNFLLDCGTHSWRVVFSGEVNDVPMSFREGTGCYVPELERLWKDVYPSYGHLAETLRGMRYRAHTPLYIDDTFDADQMTNWYRWRRWRDSLPRWERFRRWRKSVPEPDFPFFINCHAWYVQPSPYAFTCVTAKDIGIEALGREINDYWVALIKPYVEQGRTLRGYADRFYPSRSDGHPLASDLMMLWIAGNKDKFYSEVNRAIEDARMSIHDIYKEEFKGFWGVHDLIFQKKEKIRMVKVLYRGAQRHNRDIKKLMKFLGA